MHSNGLELQLTRDNAVVCSKNSKVPTQQVKAKEELYPQDVRAEFHCILLQLILILRYRSDSCVFVEIPAPIIVGVPT